MLPSVLNAQHSDAFFKISGDEVYNDRDITINDNGITNQGVGEPVPVGSGLLVLTAVGAGYALTRRNRNKGVKGLNAFIIVSALLIGMTQCKKNVNTINEVVSNEVEITLIVGDDSKANVDPTGHTNPDYATVAYEDGDTIFVGYNKQYVGYLVYSGTKFTGKVNITETVEDQPLHFYYLGGKGYKSSGVKNNSISVDISDQGVIDVADDVHRYPIISYAPSNEIYPTANNKYSAFLLNKCAMVKFNVVKPAGYDQAGTCIMGMNNMVTVDFTNPGGTDNGFTYDMDGVGEIKMHSSISGNGTNPSCWKI